MSRQLPAPAAQALVSTLRAVAVLLWPPCGAARRQAFSRAVWTRDEMAVWEEDLCKTYEVPSSLTVIANCNCTEAQYLNAVP